MHLKGCAEYLVESDVQCFATSCHSIIPSYQCFCYLHPKERNSRGKFVDRCGVDDGVANIPVFHQVVSAKESILVKVTYY